MKIDLKQVECECWVLFSCREKWTRSSSESPKLNFISNSLFQSPCGRHKVLHVVCYLTLILHLIAQNKYKGVHILRWTCTAEGTLTSLLAPWKLFRIPLKKKKKKSNKGRTEECGSRWASGELADLLIPVTLIWADWGFSAEPKFSSCLSR